MKNSNNIEKNEIKRRGTFSGAWIRLRRNKSAIAGMIIIIILLILILGADIFAPYGIDEQNAKAKFTAPCAEFIFGTDKFGRDLYSRILYGGRTSLLIGVVATSISAVLGIVLGASAGYFGGKIDNIIMRILDVFSSIPQTLLAIAIAAALGSGVFNLMLAVGISSVPRMARVVRGPILALRNQEFVDAAACVNLSTKRIIFKHVLPNALSPVIVQTTMNIGTAIISAASLSFVGLGIDPPNPEWGALLSAGRAYMTDYGYLTIFPGIFIVLTVMSFNLFGDGLRDALDPKLKR